MNNGGNKMGYCIYVNSDNFSFKVENGNKILRAVQEGIKSKTITEDRWISHSRILEVKNVEKLFDELRFDIKKKDNKYVVDFYGEKFGGYEESVFKSMAKFIDDGYLEYIGEDGEKWRYIFKNGECKEVYPKLIWEQR